MQVDLLADNFDSPLVYLIDCSIYPDYLRANIGFISMGLVDRIYELKTEKGEPIVRVKLPLHAIKLRQNVAAILSEEKFPLIQNLKPKI